MRKLLPLFIICHLSLNIFGQAATMLPDGFIIPNLAEAPACTVSDKGKMHFNTTFNNLFYCNGTNWVSATEVWGKSGNDIYYTGGKVGINKNNPEYNLDVNGTGKFNTLYASSLGLGGNTTSGLEVVNGAIAITSSADSKTWKYEYSGVNQYLALQENGVNRMVITNGGNVGIGSAIPTARLSVDGTGYFSGNLTVNGGNGLVRSINSTQLKYLTATVSTGANFTILSGGCSTATGSLSVAAFSSNPVVAIGNLVSGTGDFGKLITNVQSATTTQAVVRFCNPTGSNIVLNNIVFNLICIGQ